MPQSRNFPPKKERKGKHAVQAPETADEYLAAGVDFEEAGEKWRAGDAAKSMRFFLRALDCYEEGLKKFPHSFDLGYNKARIQYELTQYPKLLAQLPGRLLDLLYTALESSRYALKLNQENADVIFNTAQILTSIVEEITDTNDPTNPIPILEEALSLFQRCLSLQEYQYTESQVQAEAMSAEFARQETSEVQEGSPVAESFHMDESSDTRWATILEPVTTSTLIDTALASLHTLTLLTKLLPQNTTPSLLPWIQEYSTLLINDKLPAYQSANISASTTLDSSQLTILTLATFQATLATAIFQSQTPTPLTLQTYSTSTTNAISSLPTTTPATLVAKAETLITYNDTLRAISASSILNPNEMLSLRWTALATALDSLTAATKSPDTDNLAAVHLMRGNVEVLRWQLGQGENAHEAARRNGMVLLGNAGKFYRGAEKVAEVNRGRDGDGNEDVRSEARVKGELVALLTGGEGTGAKLEEEDSVAILGEAVEEGLFTVEQIRGVGVVGGMGNRK